MHLLRGGCDGGFWRSYKREDCIDKKSFQCCTLYKSFTKTIPAHFLVHAQFLHGFRTGCHTVPGLVILLATFLSHSSLLQVFYVHSPRGELCVLKVCHENQMKVWVVAVVLKYKTLIFKHLKSFWHTFHKMNTFFTLQLISKRNFCQMLDCFETTFRHSQTRITSFTSSRVVNRNIQCKRYIEIHN